MARNREQAIQEFAEIFVFWLNEASNVELEEAA